jgi:hypothetical protein
MPLSYAHVSGLYLRGDDFPASGTIIFVPSISQIVVDGALTRVSPVRAVLDRGHVSAYLLATDVGTPTGWTWQVRHRIGGDFEQLTLRLPPGPRSTFRP